MPVVVSHICSNLKSRIEGGCASNIVFNRRGVSIEGAVHTGVTTGYLKKTRVIQSTIPMLSIISRHTDNTYIQWRVVRVRETCV